MLKKLLFSAFVLMGANAAFAETNAQKPKTDGTVYIVDCPNGQTKTFSGLDTESMRQHGYTTEEINAYLESVRWNTCGCYCGDMTMMTKVTFIKEPDINN